MRDPQERDASLALRSGHGNRLRHAIGWYRTRQTMPISTPETPKKPVTIKFRPSLALISTSYAVAPHTGRRITSAPSPATMTGPAPCTSKPNRPTANYSPTSSAASWTARPTPHRQGRRVAPARGRRTRIPRGQPTHTRCNGERRPRHRRPRTVRLCSEPSGRAAYSVAELDQSPADHGCRYGRVDYGPVVRLLVMTTRGTSSGGGSRWTVEYLILAVFGDGRRRLIDVLR
jgi:hypothetical protein